MNPNMKGGGVGARGGVNARLVRPGDDLAGGRRQAHVRQSGERSVRGDNMRTVLLSIALSLFSPWVLARVPCQETIVKHERHTTSAQKRAVFLKAGVPYDHEHRPLYVVDHIVPLELGGVDEVGNMQLQTKADGHAKDLVENFLARCVCQGETPLAMAQKLVVTYVKVVTSRPCPRAD